MLTSREISVVGAVLARAQEIEVATRLRPTAITLPDDVLVGVTKVYGHHVLRAEPGLFYAVQTSTEEA